jgi:hypothetical protein
LTAVPDTLFVTGETFEQLPAADIYVTPTGSTQTTLALALRAAAGGTVTEVVVETGPFLAGAVITQTGTVISSGNPTAHGIVIGAGPSPVNSTAAMGSGQILVGQGATLDPTPQTVGGDATMDNLGNFGLINSGVLAGTYGNTGSVGVFDVDATGRILSASNVAISPLLLDKLTGTFTANGTFSVQLPALAFIDDVQFVETGSAMVPISLGTTSGGADIMDSTILNPGALSSDVLPVPNSALLNLSFVSAKSIWVNSVSWGGATVVATMWFKQ